MFAQLERSKDLISRGTANLVSKKKSNFKLGSGFVDDRHDLVTQRWLHESFDPRIQNNMDVQSPSISEKHTSQQSILQLAGGNNAFLAGDGAYWHVHYDHVKFGNDNATRVNFAGRTAKQVRSKLKEVKDRPARSKKGFDTYMECITWIDRNLP